MELKTRTKRSVKLAPIGPLNADGHAIAHLVEIQPGKVIDARE
jgi:hypothetical protein